MTQTWNTATSLMLRAGRRATEAGAVLSAPLRMMPDFLIVGAQRSGTTSLFKTLAQHRDVARPLLHKGVHYFDNNYSRSLSWYRGHFPLVAPSLVRRRGRHAITGESSPFYMFHPLVAERIAADLPSARLLVLLRDPVERAYSAHSHETARGYETLPFVEALAAEPDRLAGERERFSASPLHDSFALQHHAYLSRGRYIEQLVRLERAVGRDRLLVLDSDDFFDRPESVWPDVLGHLGLGPDSSIRFERHNARSRSPMPEALRVELRRSFEDSDEALELWWGRTPSWRR